MTTAPRRPSSTDLDDAVELLQALASGLRMRIVVELSAGPLFVKDLVARLEVSQPLVSQHLRILRSAGVVRAERRGGGSEYELLDGHLGHIVLDAIEHVHERH